MRNKKHIHVPYTTGATLEFSAYAIQSTVLQSQLHFVHFEQKPHSINRKIMKLSLTEQESKSFPRFNLEFYLQCMQQCAIHTL